MFSEGYEKELFNWGIWILDLRLDKMSELEMLKRRILDIALAAALLGDMGQVDSLQGVWTKCQPDKMPTGHNANQRLTFCPDFQKSLVTSNGL